LGVGMMDDALLKVFKDQNEEFKKLVDKEERSLSTYYKYTTVCNHLTEFISERYHKDDMEFRELTADFIRQFDFYLRYDKQCTHNTVWVLHDARFVYGEVGNKEKPDTRQSF
jgi:hypothetical protein